VIAIDRVVRQLGTRSVRKLSIAPFKVVCQSYRQSLPARMRFLLIQYQMFRASLKFVGASFAFAAEARLMDSALRDCESGRGSGKRGFRNRALPPLAFFLASSTGSIAAHQLASP
jgi:hypothetical protein